MLKAILFDLDGLLVDSEPLQFRSYQYALAQFGVSLDHQDWIQWHSVEASTSRWIKDQNLDIDVEKLRSVKKAHFDDLVRRELELKPGARELVAECSRYFKLAVVSSSRRESIEGCLNKFGMHQNFSLFVSGADLKRSKPYPDSYIEALKIMKVGPDNAIALEDSSTGYRAATAAGICCIVCPDHFIPKSDDAFSDAALVVESLNDLSPEILRTVHNQGRVKDSSEK